MKNSVKIRSAEINDIASILDIYSYYVDSSAMTFDYTAPSYEVFKQQVIAIQEKYPYYVLEDSEGIQGFAYASAYRNRPAYDWACEWTIYITPHSVKFGYGRQLYQAIENAVKYMGILNIYACVAMPIGDDPYLNLNSYDFHTHMGFSSSGIFNKCGYKFERWYDIVWMEKIIGPHHNHQLEVCSYQKVKELCEN